MDNITEIFFLQILLFCALTQIFIIRSILSTADTEPEEYDEEEYFHPHYVG